MSLIPVISSLRFSGSKSAFYNIYNNLLAERAIDNTRVLVSSLDKIGKIKGKDDDRAVYY